MTCKDPFIQYVYQFHLPFDRSIRTKGRLFKILFATILIKSSTVQNGGSIKMTQTIHFALTLVITL